MIGSLGSAAVIQLSLFASGVAAARLLGPADRGVLANLALAASLVTTLGTLGMPLAVTFSIARTSGLAPSLARTVTSSGVRQALILTPACVAVALLLCRPSDVMLLLLPALLGAAVVPAMIGTRYGTAVAQGLHQHRRVNVLRTLAPTVYGAIALLLLWSGLGSLVTFTFGWLAANIVAAAAAVRSLRATSIPATASGGWRELARFGARALAGSVSLVDTLRLDQIAVAVLFHRSSVGIYVVALAFANWPRFIGDSLGQLAYPRIARISEPSLARRAVLRWTAGSALLIVSCAAGLLVVIDHLVIAFFGEAFRASVDLARVLVIGGVVAGSRRVLLDGARGAGFVSATSAAEAVNVAAFALVAAALVPSARELGVAWAVVAGGLASSLVLGVIVLSPRATKA